MKLMDLIRHTATARRQIERVQSELAKRTVTFSAAGGRVTATARGDGLLAALRIDPDLIAGRDVEQLQNLVLTAVNGALGQAREIAAREVTQLASGLGLPGLEGRGER